MARILIVEDESIIALDLRNRVQRLGHQVIGVVASGSAALKKVAQERPDLVLMDISLKGSLNGIQTAEQLGAQFGLAVIYMTAHSDALTIENTRHTRPLGYLLKPFEDPEIEAALALALIEPPAEPEPPTQLKNFSDNL